MLRQPRLEARGVVIGRNGARSLLEFCRIAVGYGLPLKAQPLRGLCSLARYSIKSVREEFLVHLQLLQDFRCIIKI